MKTTRNLSAWAESWKYWGYAIGSDDRYKPRFYERRAYLMGLRDAARIAERERWNSTGMTPRKFARVLIESFHYHAFHALGLKWHSGQVSPGSE